MNRNDAYPLLYSIRTSMYRLCTCCTCAIIVLDHMNSVCVSDGFPPLTQMTWIRCSIVGLPLGIIR